MSNLAVSAALPLSDKLESSTTCSSPTTCSSGTAGHLSDTTSHVRVSTSDTIAETACLDEIAPGGLYSTLLGPQSAGAAVLFAWWPRAHAWSQRNQLAERCTRCLPGVRPQVDLVALPRLGEVEELWAAWAEQQGLSPWQAVWFDPGAPCGAAGRAPTPPEVALDEVVAGLPQHVDREALLLYPMYLTAEMASACERLGLQAVGDAEDHPICPLGEAKGWLHPHIRLEKRGPSLRDALPSARGGAATACGPRGFLASTNQELLEAAGALRGELPEPARLVLKPSWASGGQGIIVDVAEEQLAAFEFPPGGQHTAILEEFIEGAAESPTLYMIGGEPCGLLADQILSANGTCNDGNRWPSPSASEQLTQACVAAAQKIQQAWGLRSQWGLDFVVGRDGVPIVVDLNMGRPNGNFSVRLWESRHCQRLYLHSCSWEPPAGVAAETFFRALREQGLAWDPVALQGVLAYQHFQGQSSGYVVASSDSWEAVGAILGALRRLMEELNPAAA